MRIGVDVMGGDNAPHGILEGAITAGSALDAGDRLVLVGDQAIIQPAINASACPELFEVRHTTQVIAMDESPVEAVRAKPDSSITRIAQMAGRRIDNPLDAIISAGNTGAKVTAAQMYMRRLPGVIRPGICVTMPTFSGPVVFIDVGANIEPKPSHLAQYGVMGDVYARRILGMENPRIALMNVGGEEQKGTADMKEARDLLRRSAGLNYIGYVEGRGVFNGETDVVVTDGVVGNVMIKLAEGLSAGIFKAVVREVTQIDPQLAEPVGKVVQRIYAKHDYHETGGAPLLGVNGLCMICHGSSEARTIVNAVKRAKEYLEKHVNEAIVERLRELSLVKQPA